LSLNAAPKEGRGVEERPASALSSLSYRKRLTLKDSIGGTGDEESLFTTLSERAASPERPPRRARRGPGAAPSGPCHKAEDVDEASSVLSEVRSRVSRGLEKRWGSDFDGASTVSAPVSRASSATRHQAREDEARSSYSFSLSGSPSSRRSTSRLEGLPGPLGPSLGRVSGFGRESPDSRLSLGRSCLDDWEEDGASVALSDLHSQYSHPSLARSLSVPPRPRSAASEEPSGSGVRPVRHHSYLDPDLEAAIQEVLSYKPAEFRRSSLRPDSDEEDRKSVRSVRSAQLGAGAGERAATIRRSASAADVSGSRGRHRSRGKKRSSSSSGGSSSSGSERASGRKHRSRKSKKKSKKRRKRKETESESSESSESSSGSTVSCRSRSSIKKGPRGTEPASEGEGGPRAGRLARKEEKRRKKEVDSLMMRYLYRPESD
ncbi:NF-kappa-B-activating protein-like, partial [Gracilinanus agilis]|uniref:NF-kappa-B-activating protein-like n=1 Tax=Gracilinanus agilis TaxID=191870 RepID=UPI001CFDC551